MKIFLKMCSLSMKTKPFATLEKSLKALKKSWPKPLRSKTVTRLFGEANASLKEARKLLNGRSTAKEEGYFDFVAVLNDALKRQDVLFLSRQMTYHLVTTSNLPKAFGASGECLSVIIELMSAASKLARFGSQLEIRIEGVKMREGPVLQVHFRYKTPEPIDDNDRQRVLNTLFGPAGEKEGGIPFARTRLKRIGGGFWAEFSAEDHLVFTFYWPAFHAARQKTTVAYGMYRYDIGIEEFSRVRQRFGVTRSKKLIQMIEELIRSQVRYPIDMVVAFPEKGEVSAIYETRQGVAGTVSSRISERLKNEVFRIGRHIVRPQFKYKLTYIA